MEKDKKIADTNWGLKPDDQPANAKEVAPHLTQAYRYDPNEPDVVRKILLAQRRGFNTANRVRVEAGRTIVLDINKDEFVIEGLSYGDPKLIELLDLLGAAFNRPEFAKLPKDEQTPREFALSRAWAWGAERAGG